METILVYEIPIVEWVMRTVKQMKGGDKKKTWDDLWYKTYQELHRTYKVAKKPSKWSGTEGCPKNAAFGLYILGRIQGSGRSRVEIRTDEVATRLKNKNAAYAMIALNILEESPETKLKGLWEAVQQRYDPQQIKKKARHHQHTIAFALHREGKIVKKVE